jgi:hypothetical protein
MPPANGNTRLASPRSGDVDAVALLPHGGRPQCWTDQPCRLRGARRVVKRLDVLRDDVARPSPRQYVQHIEVRHRFLVGGQAAAIWPCGARVN